MAVNWTTEFIINRILTLREREILFLTAESAGVKVHSRTRTHFGINDYPYIYWNTYPGHLSGRRKDKAYMGEDVILYSYEEVLESLQKMIKQ